MGIRITPGLATALLFAALAPLAAAAADTVSLEPNMDRMGADYNAIKLLAADPELCRNACAQDATCKAYTYVRPGLKGPLAMCFLKNAAVAATPSDCCTSGAKSTSSGGRPPPIQHPTTTPSAPTQQITAPHSVSAKSELNKVEITWSWTSQACFPTGAGQAPQPCLFVKDIEGFRVYGSDGKLKVYTNEPGKRYAGAGYEAGMCYQVSAWKGGLESAKSAPACVDAAQAASQISSGVAVPANLRLAATAQTCMAATGDSDPAYCQALFAKNSRVLTWDYAANANIAGFHLYDQFSGQPVLVDTADSAQRRHFVIAASNGVQLSTGCLRVRAFLPGQESQSSNEVCLAPLAAPVAVPIKRTPASGIRVDGAEAHWNFNDACPLPAQHTEKRNKQAFAGSFPIGYQRENNDDSNPLSSGVLCDALSTHWQEGSVLFSLADLPAAADIESATLGFTSTSHCTLAITAYYDTLADNASVPGRSGNGWFSYLGKGAVTGEINNAPGESSTSALGVTTLVKKALAAGKSRIGFAFATDTALKDDSFSCAGSYKDFTLTLKPSAP